MLIVIEFFVKDQSELDSLSCTHHCHPLLNWKRNHKNLSEMMIHYGCLSYKLVQSCHWSVLFLSFTRHGLEAVKLSSVQSNVT